MEKMALDMQSKNKKISIMQPTFNPWIGYFSMIDDVDAFVFLDDVQLAKRSWQVRNKIKTQNGELYLSIPIRKTESRSNLLIKDAMINYELAWCKKHLSSMRQNYSKCKYFIEVFDFIQGHYDKKIEKLSNFNCELIKGICHHLGIDTTFVNSCSLKNNNFKKDEKLVNICKELKGKEYYSALGSKEYIRSDLFSSNDLMLSFQNYDHPTYDQYGGAFLSHMGVFDLLFNLGFDNSLQVIRQGKND
jgi:hypothetical protein